MKRLVIHIGNPKAGSTSLQAWLARNRDRLADVGIDYPALRRRNDDAAHRMLAHALDGTVQDEAAARQIGLLETVLAETAHDTVVLSAEQLQAAAPRAGVPARLAEIAARHGFRPLAIVFLRPQASYLNSLYAHNVRRLFTAARFDVWLPKAMTEDRYDYATWYRQWSERPDMDFKPVAFTGAELAIGLERRFLMAAGLSGRLGALEDLPTAFAANEAPGPLTLETYRRIARKSGRARIGAAYPEARAFVQAETDRLGWNRTRFSGLDPATVASIEERFAASNAEFAVRHWRRPWTEVFAPDTARPPVRNEVDPAGVDPRFAAEMDAIAEAALERYGRPERLVERMRRAFRPGSL
jgi:hypothetical protein